MTPTSHRRCQYRGEGCTGMAHSGFDQCAHCYYQFVKPALQAERAEVKRRRQIKKQRLWPETRAHINAVDLDEPQILEAMSVRDAVIDHAINTEINQAIANGKDPIDYAATMLTKLTLNDIPLPVVRPTAIRTDGTFPSQKEDPPVTEIEEPTVPLVRPPLSDEAQKEVCDAYVAGMNVNEILRAYEIHTGILYPLLRQAGIPLRSELKRPPSLRRPIAPPPRRKPQMPSITPPASQTPVTAPPPNGVVSGLTEWTVTYLIKKTETRVVAAKSFNDAAASVESDGVEVVSVARVLP